MYRASDIKANLLNLVGWQQNPNPSEDQIAQLLTISESGLYFQHQHPLLTLQNLKLIAPDFSNYVYPQYDPTEIYPIDKVVTYDIDWYRAVKTSLGEVPENNPEYWVKTDPFSLWLENKTLSSIQKAISTFIEKKVTNLTSKAILENKVLFDGTGRLADLVDNNNNIVGLEIVPIRSYGVTTKINRIGLQFTKTGQIELYVFHSSSKEFVRKLIVNITKANSMQWFSYTDLFLPYISEDVDAGGSWYICYDQGALAEGQFAIRKERDWSKGPCTTCSRLEYNTWLAWSKYLEVHPFRIAGSEVERTELSDIQLWDVQGNIYDYLTNYGINLDISVLCDITDFITSQRSLFSNTIALQVACDLLREMAFNPNARLNRNTVLFTKADILYELDGDSQGPKEGGLGFNLKKAYDSLDISLREIDRVCLKCGNKGIKYRSI